MWREDHCDIDQIEDDLASPPAALVLALLSEDLQAEAAIIQQLNAFYARFNPGKDGKAVRVWMGMKKQYGNTAARELEKSLMHKYACNLSTFANTPDRTSERGDYDLAAAAAAAATKHLVTTSVATTEASGRGKEARCVWREIAAELGTLPPEV